jgi:hypothetical protein
VFSSGDAIMANPDTPIVMEVVTDPVEIAEALARHARFQRNSAWLQAHIPEVYSRHRGKCIAVAGQELFVADTPEEVMAQAQSAHPEDDAVLIRYIPKERLERIYANRRQVVAVR